MDTAPIIYFLDEDINYAEKVKKILSDFLENEKQMVTSTITCTEYMTYPYRMGNEEKINAFHGFIHSRYSPFLPRVAKPAEYAL